MTTPTNDDDIILVHQAQADPRAFAALYHKYLGPVYRYLYAHSGEQSAAEDLTSQVFLAALEGLGRYRHQGSFAAWLFGIARRKVVDAYRARPQAPLEDYEERLCSDEDPLAQAIQSEEMRCLAEKLAGLYEDERDLLRLRFAAGLSFDEIAGLLERKPSAVKMSLYRLLERLRGQMHVLTERKKDETRISRMDE